jgi:hypothetical protein
VLTIFYSSDMYLFALVIYALIIYIFISGFIRSRVCNLIYKSSSFIGVALLDYQYVYLYFYNMYYRIEASYHYLSSYPLYLVKGYPIRATTMYLCA